MTTPTSPIQPMRPRDMDLYGAALRYIEAGLALLPIGGNKKPLSAALPVDDEGRPTWKPLRELPASWPTVENWFNEPGIQGLAAICGSASAGLLVLDFDDPNFYHRWRQRIGKTAGVLPTQQTGRGIQVALRCDSPGPNIHLAWKPAKSEPGGRVVAIETRGEGGYAILPPSIHPSGRRYTVLHGDFARIPTLKQGEVEQLIIHARELDEAPFSQQEVKRAKAATVKQSPRRHGSVIEAWNQQVPIRHMLKRAGYIPFRDRFTRPGDHASPGSVVVFDDSGHSYHHSTNDPLHNGHAHDSFSVFCEMEHGGDIKAAVKAAAGELGIDQHLRENEPAVAADFKRTDLGNAERLVARHGDRMRYCRGEWLIYDGTHWKRDEKGQVTQWATDTVRAILDEASKTEDDERRPQLAQWAIKSESRNYIENMIALARSQPGIGISPNELDRDPWLFNCLNGTLDLRSGKLRPHCADDLISICAPVKYDPNVPTPRWERFLNRIFDEDVELIGYVERMLGMCLTADVREQYLWLFHGEGNNGKNVLLDTVCDVMGDYATQAAPNLLILSRRERHPTEIADLRGRRLVIASETEENAEFCVQLVKRLTGDGRLKGRKMNKDFFEFDRTHKLILVTNNLPKVEENTEAIWRRLRVVPFNVIIRAPELDKDLRTKLQIELPGILTRLVRAGEDWLQEGLKEPQAVIEATERYRQTRDPFRRFFSECCAVDAMEWIKVGDLQQIYEQWCQQAGKTPLGRNHFIDRLKKQGLEQSKKFGNRVWLGVRLRPGLDAVGALGSISK